MTTKWGRSFILTAQRTQTVTNAFSSTTGRISGWTYDANGNVMSGGDVANTYDESGWLRQMVGSSNIMGQFEYDGDGSKVKRTSDFDLSTPTQTYYLYSSVLGQNLKEIGGVNGDTGYVYADGELVATRNSGSIYWQHKDPSLRSMRTTIEDGSVLGREELDPNDVTVFNPFAPPQPHGPGSGGGPHGPGGTEAKVASLMDISLCDIGGEEVVPCSMVKDLQPQIQSSVGLPDKPPPAVGASAIRITLNPISTIHESAHVIALASSSGGEDEKKDGHVFGSVDISGSLDPLVVRLEALSSSIINQQGSTPTLQYYPPAVTPIWELDEDIHCDKKVAAALDKITSDARRSRYGGAKGFEFGFRVDYKNGSYQVSEIFTKYSGLDVDITGINSSTVALFHTHDREPGYSRIDVANANGTSEAFEHTPIEGHKTVSYVQSPFGLSLYNGTRPTNPDGSRRIVKAAKCP